MNKAAYFYATVIFWGSFPFFFSCHIGVAEQSFDGAEWWSGTIPPPVLWSHMLVDLAGCGETMSQFHPVGDRHEFHPVGGHYKAHPRFAHPL